MKGIPNKRHSKGKEVEPTKMIGVKNVKIRIICQRCLPTCTTENTRETMLNAFFNLFFSFLWNDYFISKHIFAFFSLRRLSRKDRFLYVYLCRLWMRNCLRSFEWKKIEIFINNYRNFCVSKEHHRTKESITTSYKLVFQMWKMWKYVFKILYLHHKHNH